MRNRLWFVLCMLFVLGCGAAALAQQPYIPGGPMQAEVMTFGAQRIYPVYAAPDEQSLRGSKGKASVNTADWVQVFGRTEEWLLVQYQVSAGQYRIGYITADEAAPADVPRLHLTSRAVTLTADVSLTDDPLGKRGTLCRLRKGDHVTWLSCLGTGWAYVSGTSGGKAARGFVPMWAVRAGLDEPICENAALFPAMGENGMYGYIDLQGAFVIPPRYVSADMFIGQYACVSVSDDYDHEGFIDIHGNWVVPPDYTADMDMEYAFGAADFLSVTLLKDRKEEWLNLHNGFFSGSIMHSNLVYGVLRTNMILCGRADDDRYSIVRLDNGEEMPWEILDSFTAAETISFNSNTYVDGTLQLMIPGDEGRDTTAPLGGWAFLDEAGHAVAADPAWTWVDTWNTAYCELIPAVEQESGMQGYLSVRTGRAAFPELYSQAESFNEFGTAAVQFREGDWGIINTEGRVLSRGYGSCPEIAQDAAWIPDLHSLVTIDGDVLLTLADNGWKPLCSWKDGMNIPYYLIDDAHVLLMYKQFGKAALMSLDGTVIWNSEIWNLPDELEVWPWYHRGMLVLKDEKTERMGIVDLTGRQVMPYAYTGIDISRNDLLIRLRTDTQDGWYTLQGEKVYTWQIPQDEQQRQQIQHRELFGE